MAVNLVNRNPVPGQFGVPVSPNIFLGITSSGLGIDLSSIDITVSGETAVSGGTFQSGFSGTITATVSGYDIDINPSQNFDYNSLIEVIVDCDETGGGFYQQSYSFTTKRNIQISTSVNYYEDGDIIEASIQPYEDAESADNVVSSLTFQTLRGATVIDSIEIDNSTGLYSVEGAFYISLLHPKQLGDDLTWTCSVSIDPYAAPGVNSLTVGGDISYIASNNQFLHATQPSRLTIETLPRHVDSSGEYQTKLQEAEVSRQVIDLSNSKDSLTRNTLMVDLDFTDTQQYIHVLSGDPVYTGGGNRLLPSMSVADRFLVQDFSEIPPTFGAQFFAEPETTNIATNSSQFSDYFFTPAAYDATLKLDSYLEDFTSDGAVKAAHYRLEGGVTYDSVGRNFNLESGNFSLLDLSKPVRASMLVRVEPRNEAVTLDLFRLRVSFLNSSDFVLGDFDFDFDVFDFSSETSYRLMEGIVPSVSIPVSTTKVKISLIIGSWEGCDLLDVWLAAPCLDGLNYTTSPVVGLLSVTRSSDVFKIAGYGNISSKFGTIELGYQPMFSGSPPLDTTLWDTRNSSLLNGYVLMHKQSGDLVLQVWSTSGLEQTLTSALFSPDEDQTVSFIWTPDSLSLKSGTSILATFAGSYNQPVANDHISLGCRIDGQEQAMIVPTRFRILS